ncbi:MAG: hypothetical protein JXC36_08025 [Candidatus Atribacteria bacterium]|nr:hypothetical protein [Candidatus Atribacteria bacterium]
MKSNSEKWHKLYNFNNLKNFLITHSDKIPWIDNTLNVEEQATNWIYAKLPKFQDEYSSNLYEYEEIQKYKSKHETEKARAIAALCGYTRDQINDMIEKRLNYVMSKIKVLETHFVSGRSGISERTQATPRKDEFNVIAIDVVIRYPEHKFLFANPQNLESSGEDPNHLQQNYIMGFIFTNEQGNPILTMTDDWYEDLNDVYETLDTEDSINKGDMQIDNRYIVLDEE